MSPATASPTRYENLSQSTSTILRNAQQRAIDVKVARIRQTMAERYQALWRVGVHVDGALVRLTGRVASYYQKQLATTVVLSLDGVERLENDLQVCR